MIQKTNLIFIIPFLFLFSCCIDSEKDLLKDATVETCSICGGNKNNTSNGGTSTGCGCCDNCETPNIDSGTTDDDDNTSSNNPLDDNFVPPAEPLPLSKDFKLVKGATIEGAIQAEGYTESPGFVAGKKVTIADFYMCDHEVTQKEFALYYEGYEARINENEKGIGPNYPAYDVNWFDTFIYCNNRSIAEGRTPCYTISGSTNPKDWGKIPKDDDWKSWEDWVNAECDFSANGYRLPTHREWEYAARGGNGLKGYQFQYAGSDNLDEVAVWNTDVVSEIKTKKPNGLGIYDLNGNLDEWTFQRWGDYILYAGGYYFIKQPEAFALSWHYSGCIALSPVFRNRQLGLRVVCTAD